jgi:hypothetical protein
MSGPITSTETVLRLREARNRMIDLLGLAETYPVRDLPVPNERLTVPFNATAAIKVEISEKQVVYALRDKDGHPAGAAVTGTGDTVVLTTPAIRDDITYTVHARSPTGREADLFETATVKVGLDLTLNAVVLPEDGPTPRVLDFGATVTVLIPFSQDGVDYRLVRFPNGEPAHPDDMAAAANDDIVSDGDHTVRGTGGPIQLPSKPLQNDTVLRIRAIKVFDATLARPPQTNILAVHLPVFVRADTGLAVTSDPGPIFDFQAARFARVAAARAGVEYRAVLLRVADMAFAQGATAAPDVIAVPVPDQPDAMIRLPSLTSTGALDVPPGFVIGADWQAGAGADLRLALPPAGADTIVAVAARKAHVGASGPFVSAVWLRSMIAQLVRPNPSPAPTLSVTLAGGGTDGALVVSGGQPGVFYTPRVSPAGAPILPPAYVHQRDPNDPNANKGIGQLKLEVDFAVAREGQPPRPPVLATGAIPIGTTLAIQAMVAQSRVAIDLPAQAVIAAIPTTQLATALVDHGGTAHVLVQASLATDTYALFQEGAPDDVPDDVPVGPPRDGNGQTLDFPSAALTRDTVLVLAATSKAPIPVRRRTRLSVAVRPDPSLAVRARDSAVPANTATAILVDASEPGISYQVVAGGAPVGSAVPGTGATLALPVGPIAATTTFSVLAARLLPPAANVTLTATATVTLKPS